MKKKLKDALHRYKVEAFKISHNLATEEQDEVSRDILEHTDEALNNAYRFHFDEDTDPEKVEIFRIVKSVMQETILPPVVQKIMRRVTVLEHQHQQLVLLLDELMEALSDD